MWRIKVTEWVRTGRLGWGGGGRLWDNWDVSKRGGECRRMWDGRNAAIKSHAIKLEHGGKLGCEENSRGSCYRRLNVCPGITAHELVTSTLCFLIRSCPPSAMAFVLPLGWSHWWEDTGTPSDSSAGLNLYSDAPNFYATSLDDGKVGQWRCFKQPGTWWGNHIHLHLQISLLFASAWAFVVEVWCTPSPHDGSYGYFRCSFLDTIAKTIQPINQYPSAFIWSPFWDSKPSTQTLILQKFRTKWPQWWLLKCKNINKKQSISKLQ